MSDAPCVIGKGIQIRGNLSGSGDLVIEGRVEGHIALEDHLSIEQSGILVADTETRELTVRGRMNGDMNASERVSITAMRLWLAIFMPPEW